MFLRPLALSALLCAATPAFAQDSTATTTDADLAASMGGDSITIGAGGAYLPDYEGSNDYRFTPVPGAIGSIGGMNFQLAGNRLSVDLIPSNGSDIDFQFGPIGVVNFNRTSLKSIDDTRIRALGEVDTAIELGGYVGIGKTGIITSPYDKLSISLSYRHDVTDAHDSAVWQPSIAYLTPLSRKSAVSIFGSAERVERGYGRAYFSVSPAQAIASGLPAYQAQGGWKNWSVGALATVSLTGDLLHGLKFVAGGTYKQMLNDYADSPVTRIAGSRSQWMGAAGLAFTF